MRNLTYIIFLTFFLFFSHFMPTNAQNSLESRQIEQYLTSLVKIKTLINSAENEIRTTTEEVIPSSNNYDASSRTPITDTLVQIKKHHTFKRFENDVITSGFITIEQWATVGDKIMMAYSAYHLKNPPPGQNKNVVDIEKDLSDDLKKIENNKFISPEHKKLLTEKIQNSIALLNDPNYIDHENIKIISPYIERLNSLFKEPQ